MGLFAKEDSCELRRSIRLRGHFCESCELLEKVNTKSPTDSSLGNAVQILETEIQALPDALVALCCDEVCPCGVFIIPHSV